MTDAFTLGTAGNIFLFLSAYSFSVFDLSKLGKVNGALFNKTVCIGPIDTWLFKEQLYLSLISFSKRERVGKSFASTCVWRSRVAPHSILFTVASVSSLISVLDTFICGYCEFFSPVSPPHIKRSSESEQAQQSLCVCV